MALVIKGEPTKHETQQLLKEIDEGQMKTLLLFNNLNTNFEGNFNLPFLQIQTFCAPVLLEARRHIQDQLGRNTVAPTEEWHQPPEEQHPAFLLRD